MSDRVIEDEINQLHKFLRQYFGDSALTGVLNVWTKDGSGSHQSAWFDFDNLREAAEYAVSQSELCDVYFGVCPRDKPVGRSKRGDLKSLVGMPGLWMDIDIQDPNAHAEKSLPLSLEEVLAFVSELPFQPTVLVSSGHGVHAYWLFDTPLVWGVADDAQRNQAVELSRAFQRKIISDANQQGWNLDLTADAPRVLRLPFTLNHKDGETSKPVLIISDDGPRHNPIAIANQVAGFRDADNVSDGVNVSDISKADLQNIEERCAWMKHCCEDAADLSESAWYRQLSIIARCAAADKFAHERSKPYAGYDRAETAAKLEQALSKAGPVSCAYVQNSLSSAEGKHCRNCPYNGRIKSPIILGSDTFDEIAEINDKYAYVIVGNQGRVLREEINRQTGKIEIEFLTVEAFKQLHGNRFIQQSGGRRVPLGQVWMQDPLRRTYQGIVFEPEIDTGRQYNTWQGFAVEPNHSGNCDLFLQHLRENVAQGDESQFQWIFGFLAQIVQYPREKPGVALVITGEQGTGKTIIGDVMSMIIGNHYLRVEKGALVTGRFNKQLDAKLMVHADEAFFAGDKNGMRALRGLITSNTTMIEPKGVDSYPAANYSRIVITGQDRWIVEAAKEERRFAIFEIGPGWKQDSEKFSEMLRDMHAGGSGRLLQMLLDFDLEKVDLRRIPVTSALADQIEASYSTIENFWKDLLYDGFIDLQIRRPLSAENDSSEWPSEVNKDDFWRAYKNFCKDTGDRFPMGKGEFFKQLYRLCPSILPQLKRRFRVYGPGGIDSDIMRMPAVGLPPLHEARRQFNAKTKHRISWPDNDGKLL